MQIQNSLYIGRIRCVGTIAFASLRWLDFQLAFQLITDVMDNTHRLKMLFCCCPCRTLNGTTGTPAAGPANSPLSSAGPPIYSPNAATAALQPRYLFHLSTGAILMAYLFT